MMKKAIFVSAAMVMFLAACNSNDAPRNANTLMTNSPVDADHLSSNNPAAVNGKKGTLLFFMNPYGAPCQMQDSIINEAFTAIKDTVDVKYVKTTNPEDTETFYTYSIRGLPSMIIIDKNNTVIKRFSPGIQSSDAIIRTVKEL